jgi:hypothetical protein
MQLRWAAQAFWSIRRFLAIPAHVGQRTARRDGPSYKSTLVSKLTCRHWVKCANGCRDDDGGVELCDPTREYAKKAGHDVSPQEMVEKVSLSSPLVDVERTKRESGNTPTKRFLRSPYGIQYHPESKNWIPFRHDELKL